MRTTLVFRTAHAATLILLSACGGGGGSGERDDAGIAEPVARAVVITEADGIENGDLREACGRTPDHVVVINNFRYQPALLRVKRGETVAWVNLERCADALVDSSAPITGCDNHHQVITFPERGRERVESGPICSPVPGVASPLPVTLPGFDIDPRSCAQDGGSNVFCHTFREVGRQHYTCFTNPGHTLLMNGYITVTE